MANEKTVTTMVKMALKFFLCVSIVGVYILALFVATKISVKILGMDDADDIDYALTANAIQFFVMVTIIAGKVTQWIN